MAKQRYYRSDTLGKVFTFKNESGNLFDPTTISIAIKEPDGTFSAVTTVHRARASNIATIGTAAHGLAVGNGVKVSGMGGTGYNGNVIVLSVPDTTHFTYANTGSDESEIADTGGTITRTTVATKTKADLTNTGTGTYKLLYNIPADATYGMWKLVTTATYTVGTLQNTEEFTFIVESD